ncbi:MAG: hypothetical protein ACRD17_09380 [Terriglobales bacterium]
MDVEKTIQFILDSLARLAAHAERHDQEIAELREAQIETSRQITSLAGAEIEIAAVQRNLVGAQGDLTRAQDDLTRAQEGLTLAQQDLARAQEDLTRALEELTKKQRELAESQAHSDARLDALINIVDRMQRRPETGS